MSKTLKVFYKTEILRIPFVTCNYLRFCNIIENILQIKKYVLKYKDDENDMISIYSDLELQEFYKHFDDKILKITVEERKTNNSKNKNKNITNVNNSNFSNCSNCNEKFEKFSWKCRKCVNYNICDSCYISQNVLLRHRGAHERTHSFEQQNVGNRGCVICTECNERVFETRWKCLKCSMIGICNNCYALYVSEDVNDKNHKKSHTMDKILVNNLTF